MSRHDVPASPGVVPISQFEISVGGDNKVSCCNNHGVVLSLDPKTGQQQWRYDTMPEAQLSEEVTKTVSQLLAYGVARVLWLPLAADHS